MNTKSYDVLCSSHSQTDMLLVAVWIVLSWDKMSDCFTPAAVKLLMSSVKYVGASAVMHHHATFYCTHRPTASQCRSMASATPRLSRQRRCRRQSHRMKSHCTWCTHLNVVKRNLPVLNNKYISSSVYLLHAWQCEANMLTCACLCNSGVHSYLESHHVLSVYCSERR